MKTKLNLLSATMFLTAVTAGFGQPIITQQPQSCTNCVGSIATFTVTATGTEPLVYQWQKLGGTWTDLTGCAEPILCLTNIQTSHAGDYRVVITNADGAMTSQVAKLTVVLPPGALIRSMAPYQRMAVYGGSNTALRVNVSGTAPLSVRWQLDGSDLPGGTNQILTLPSVQLSNEGNYTVVVTNPWGSVTSAPVRLYVTPPASQMIRRDFTNAVNLRLPYWYLLPEDYSPNRGYPLVCTFHGDPGGETYFEVYANDLGPQALGLVFASYKQQQADPAIVVWPARRVGDTSAWTGPYLQQILELLDALITEFHVDTNRLYMVGYSEGVHAVWDCLGSRPGFFAGAMVQAGWTGGSRAVTIKDVPLWATCARDDSLVSSTRPLVLSLRQAGGNPIYTEYQTGGHYDGSIQAKCSPVAVDWLLAQRRGVAPTCEPLLVITNPTPQNVLFTGTTNLALAGFAAALGQPISQITWTNSANNAKGTASGSNAWSVTNIPLVASKTNVIVVVATTTSWAPAFGGNTTFNDTLTVIQSPIRATLTTQGTEAILNWTGGGAPYRVQRATDLTIGVWVDYLPSATPPVTLPLEGQSGFYRILGQ
jgi:poly(3-hydroxybutyrate) depolymerase